MTKKRNIHTTYNSEDKEWQTKLEGQNKPLSTANTKAEAMQNSRGEAQKRGVEHIIHNKNGRISDSDSYGNDPVPPKDKKH